MSVKTNRFSGALWFNKEHNSDKTIDNYPALIVGLGATGSFLSLFLARAGVKDFILVDPDIIEPHNNFSQLFSYSQLEQEKVFAANENMNSFATTSSCDTYVSKIEELDWGHVNHSKIYLATLDSMAGRKYLFEKWLEDSPEDSIFFDSRIGAELWEVYAIEKGNQAKIDKYKETLFSDEEGNGGACNYQQSSHSAAGAAIKIVELLTNWITNNILEETDLPYKVTNDIRTCTYGVNS